MNCIIANINVYSRKGMYAYVTGLGWDAAEVMEATALQHALTQYCDAIILYNMPFCTCDGQLFATIRKSHPQAAVIAYVHPHDTYSLRQCIHEDVAACISTTAQLREANAAIEAIGRGRHYVSYDIQQAMRQYHIERGSKPLFSELELEVLQLYRNDIATKDIAKELCKTEDTINKIRSIMLQKTNTHSLTALSQYASDHGYLPARSQ